MSSASLATKKDHRKADHGRNTLFIIHEGFRILSGFGLWRKKEAHKGRRSEQELLRQHRRSEISPCLSVVENGGNSQFRNVNSLRILSVMGQSSYYHDKPPVCKPRSNTQRLFAWGRRLSHIGDRSSLRAPHGAILFFWQNKRHWYIDTSNTSIPCDRMSYHNRMLCRNEHNESGPQQCMSACSRRA